jgi:hypothetical protein
LKPDFDKCEKAATRLLLKQNIHSLRIDVRSLVYDKKIFFDSIQNYCKVTNASLSEFIGICNGALKDGFTLERIKNCSIIYIVLYNDEIGNRERLNWTLAHEVGHIYLDHKSDGPQQEIEAHFFATQLLMPEVVILYLARRNNGIGAEELCDLFDVSFEAACKRINTLNHKYSYFYGQEEKELLSKYSPLINNSLYPVYNAI